MTVRLCLIAIGKIKKIQSKLKVHKIIAKSQQMSQQLVQNLKRYSNKDELFKNKFPKKRGKLTKDYNAFKKAKESGREAKKYKIVEEIKENSHNEVEDEIIELSDSPMQNTDPSPFEKGSDCINDEESEVLLSKFPFSSKNNTSSHSQMSPDCQDIISPNSFVSGQSVRSDSSESLIITKTRDLTDLNRNKSSKTSIINLDENSPVIVREKESSDKLAQNFIQKNKDCIDLDNTPVNECIVNDSLNLKPKNFTKTMIAKGLLNFLQN